MKKTGRVVADQVPVPFLGVELHGKAAGIARGVGRTLLAADGGEAGEGLALVADLGEQLRRGVLGDVVGDDEVAMRARTLGVHDALGNALAVELRHLLEELEVVEGNRSTAACRYRVLIVAHRTSLVGGEARCRALVAAVRSIVFSHDLISGFLFRVTHRRAARDGLDTRYSQAVAVRLGRVATKGLRGTHPCLPR